MNKLEKLISELCPNGVEYKTLSSVSRIERGTRITKKDLVEKGDYPVISGGVTPMGRYDKYNRDKDTITISSYGQAGYVDFVRKQFWANDVCLTVFPNNVINNKYLYYVLKNCQNYFYANTTKAIPDHIPTEFLLNTEIPVPPLSIQEEIVRILDNFTELAAELAAELQDRKKQYEYYRDSLLTFNNDIKSMKLKDIVNICLGLTATPNYVDNGVKFISAKDISKDYLDLSDTKYISEDDYKKASSNAKPKRGDILFTRVGSNLGHPVLVETDEKLCMFVSLGFMRVIDDNLLNNRYLKHWLNSQSFWKQVESKTYGSAKVNLNTGWLNEFDITIPSLEVQKRIVNVLDNFEKICNDLKIGLPAEIELRQKQYEYYRDMLLTFPENDLCLSKQASKQASKHSYNYDEIKLLQYVYGYVNVELGELCCLITKGTTPRKFTLEGINFVKTECFNNGQIEKNKMSFISEETHFKELKRSILNVGDILITIAGATIGKCAIVTEDIIPANTNQALAIIRLNNKTMIKYIFYVLNSKTMKKYIETKVKGSAQPNLTLQHINEFILSIPSLEEQERIVNILDNFEKYCNDIFEGLPAEIKYRQQQYEYYRDKLLSFKRLED